MAGMCAGKVGRAECLNQQTQAHKRERHMAMTELCGAENG